MLEGFTYRPLPPRKGPEVQPASATKAPAKKAAPSPRKEKMKARADQVAEMAKTMTCQQVHEATGISKQALFRASREGNFVFRRAERKKSANSKRDAQRQIQRNLKRIEELKVVQKICALRDTGLHRAQVAEQLGLNYGTLVKIIERNDINFPRVRIRK
ncbi:hypothetical protein QU926_20605 [Pseudomonas asiatica]|uniref:hypothetical protein n=1 Tax=Pseudomonas asiatica TaxID=2219225 RepID=UPI0025AA7886|nr:hypothetical protein [Pseudomonas asiatica]MDM9556017.1 hypothetical protein [Pseudomonas asiatica]